MLRFPNPGSTLANFIEIFKNINEKLLDYTFDLDDMVIVTAERGMASSSGFIGKEAIDKSTRKDRSRDPLYNQLKMYSELYRHLGWIKSSSNKALNFNITPFGELVAKSKDPIHEFILSILCISFPNESIESKSKAVVRPFFTILKIINKIQKFITRDEIIISILNCENDYGEKNLEKITNRIKHIRTLKSHNEDLIKIEKETKIKVNTLKNYTRVPIMFLRDSGLFKSDKGKLILSPLGQKYSEMIDKSYDLRSFEFKNLKLISFKDLNLSIYGNVFEGRSLKKETSEILKTDKKVILFNFFQQFDDIKISKIIKWKFNKPLFKKKKIIQDDVKIHNYSNILKERVKLFNNSKIENTINSKFIFENDLENLAKIKNFNKFTQEFCQKFLKSDINIFYPLIRDLFNILKLKCINSRIGVNQERWDSMLFVNNKIIPIEIKSPSEELYVNVKGIRQALENKIILESRYNNLSNFNHTSLVVAYNLPKNRSEVSRLIIDIKKTFDIKIGVIDLFTLSNLVFLKLSKKKIINNNQILNLNGYFTL